MSDNNVKADIAKEIYRALDDLCADPQLLSIVGSYGETLTDEEVLAYLKAFNETGSMFSSAEDRRLDWKRAPSLASSPDRENRG
jgi:hypothetical protein